MQPADPMSTPTPSPLPPGDHVPATPPRSWGGRFLDLFRKPVPDTEFMPDATAAWLESPPAASHWLLWGVAAFFLTALIWAAIAEVDQIVSGQGKVIPSSQVQLVQNLEGGIVSAIHVKAGDRVEKGQVLMQLDPTRFSSQFEEGSARDLALRVRIARLSAEATSLPFSAPEDLEREHPELVANERAVHRSRGLELESNLVVFRQQRSQKEQELREVQARQRQLADSLALASRELELTRPLVGQGAASHVEVLRLDRAVNELRGELESSRLAEPRVLSAIEEARGKIAGIHAQFRAEASRELSLARAEQAAASAANVGLADRVERTQVRAPAAGIVKQVKVATVGGVVQPGVELMEIVPAEDRLLVEGRVKPSDIAFLKVGQPASVRLSAYDYSIYGDFDATLEYIGADTVVPDPATTGRDAEPYYEIRVRTNSNTLRGQDRPVTILPGMEATVAVRTDKRTILQYLMKPLIKTRQNAFRER